MRQDKIFTLEDQREFEDSLLRLNPKEQGKVVIRMPNWLGDAVMSLPTVHAIRKAFPQAEIHALALKSVATLLENNPDIDRIVPFNKPCSKWQKLEARHIILGLQKEKYDLGFLLTNSFSSAWWFWRGSVKTRVGFSGNMRRALLSHAFPFPENKEKQHLVKTYLSLVKRLDIPTDETLPKIYLSDEEKRQARELIGKDGHRCIGINPGAAFGSAKCWIPERFREVAFNLASKPNTKVIFFGDPAGQSLVDEICQNTPPQILNLAGKTSLRELIACIDACDQFLTNDSGPMHIAAAVQTPLVALFGPTNEIATGPYRFGTIIHKHAPCSPCYKRVCPIDHRCMHSISSEEVETSILELNT